MASPFVHLHTHSEFSLLDGAARLDKLVKRATQLDMGALALTDHGVMYGTIEFYKKCKDAGIKPILGVEAYVAPHGISERAVKGEKAAYHLLLLAKNLTGYKNLLKLTTIAALEGFYHKPRVDHEILRRHSEGLIATSACLGSEVCAAILKGDYNKARDTAAMYREIFGADNFFIELQDHTLPEQRRANEDLLKISRELKLPILCTNDVHYISREDAYAHDVLLCIGTGSNVHETNRLKYGAEEFFMKSAEEMAEIFRDHPEAIHNTQQIADRCDVTLEFGRAQLPAPDVPDGKSAIEYLRDLAENGLDQRIGRVTDEYRERLNYELSVIETTGFAPYFLIVRDFARFARDRGIFFGVRGSAAGSLTSFAVEITDIDPVDYELTFERFLNPERVQMPDIDMDFEDARRGEVIDYVTQRYGTDHVAQIVTFGTMAAKAAIKDAGRALAIPLADVNRIAGMIPSLPIGITIEKAMDEVPELKGAYQRDEVTRNLLDTAQRLEGISRHSSVHAAGVVISHEPLVEYTPLQKSQEGGLVTQFPAAALETIGLLKMDFLGLINLSILGRTVENIEQSHGVRIDVGSLPMDDAGAYEILGRGETTGVFQLESDGMRRYITQLKPTSVRELAAMIALYRPGPMAHIPTYIRAKHGTSKIKYPHPRLKEVLEETYGVIVYQDQVMRIAQVIAGYTLGQADLLRRAMGKKKKEVMAAERERFVEGALSTGVEAKDAEAIFDLIEPFAGYAFNKAHAVCYANIAYQTAYLKANYPVEYMAALLGCFMEKPDKMAVCLDECRRLRLPLLPPCINRSQSNFTSEGDAIRFGLAGIRNVGKAAVELMLNARAAGGDFKSLDDLVHRVSAEGQMTKATVEALAHSGALEFFHSNRRALGMTVERVCAEAGKAAQARKAGQSSLFGFDEEPDTISFEPTPVADVAEFSPQERLKHERELLGIYLSGHPLDRFAEQIEKRSTCEIQALNQRADREEVWVGGIITSVRPLRSRKNNEPMANFVLENSRGATVAVTVFPSVFRDFGRVVEKDHVILMRGRIQSRDSVRDDDGEDTRLVELLADELHHLTKPDPVIVADTAGVTSMNALTAQTVSEPGPPVYAVVRNGNSVSNSDSSHSPVHVPVFMRDDRLMIHLDEAPASLRTRYHRLGESAVSSTLRQVRQILESHPGEAPVQVVIAGLQGNRVIAWPGKVHPSDTLLGALSEILIAHAADELRVLTPPAAG